MDLEFSGPMFEWRGPAPYHFIEVPEDEADELRDAAAYVTYGWGMIPVVVAGLRLAFTLDTPSMSHIRGK